MIHSYEQARDDVSDVVEEALIDHFNGSHVDAIDSGIFSVEVEKGDGSHYVVNVTIA